MWVPYTLMLGKVPQLPLPCQQPMSAHPWQGWQQLAALAAS